jgi:hypothetical protein
MLEIIIRKSFFASIALILGLNKIFLGYSFFGLSIDKIIIIVIFFFLFNQFIVDFNKCKILKLFCYINVLLFIFATYRYVYMLVNGEHNTIEPLIRLIAKHFTFVCYIYLVYFIIKKNYRYLFISLFTIIVFSTLATFEHPITPFTDLALSIKNKYFSVNMPDHNQEDFQEFLYKVSGDKYRCRVSGPYNNCITFSYIIIPTSILIIYLFIKTKFAYLLIMFGYLYFISLLTLTRSLVIGNTIMGIYLIFYLLKNKKMKNIIIFSGIIICLSIFLSTYLNKYNHFNRIFNTTEHHRPTQALIGIVTILEFPLGVSESNREEVRKEVSDFLNSPTISGGAHNGIINLGIRYTIFGIPIFFVFLIKLAKYLKNNNRKLRILFIFSFIAYMVNSSLHNNFIFHGDFSILIILAIFIYEYESNLLKIKNNKVINIKLRDQILESNSRRLD